jgi:hypothetical protein
VKSETCLDPLEAFWPAARVLLVISWGSIAWKDGVLDDLLIGSFFH